MLTSRPPIGSFFSPESIARNGWLVARKQLVLRAGVTVRTGLQKVDACMER